MTTRRTFLASAALALPGSRVLSARTEPSPGPIAGRAPDADLRVVFMTDTHLRAADDPEHTDTQRATERVAAGFKSALDAKPDLIVFGGDNVFAVDYANTVESAVAQFENWKRVIAAHAGDVESVAVIGNHDIWNGEHAERHDKGYKRYALEAFGMPARYYARQAGAWLFCMLDTYHRDGCHIDDEQFAWLEAQVDAHQGPVCLVHHAPIVTVGQFLEQKDPGLHAGYNAPRGWVVGNAADLVRFVGARDNIRLSLCGHMHQIEDLDYLGCRWVDGGAVSGAWWGGEYLDHFPCNIMVLDLTAEGDSTVTVVNYED